MNLLTKFTDHIKLKNGFTNQHQFLLAVSGGIDSVVLCDLFHKAKLQFSIAHCNFQLRGAESERDELFVKELAKKYEVDIFVQHFDTKAYAENNKLSTQVAARDLRYDWFRQLIAEGKASYIVTAHHADDNIETVVMNFFRGTGLKGLIGMDEHFQQVWRPLLGIRRKEILDYAAQHELQHVEDSSNASSNYTRNYFRNEMLPAIAQVFPQVVENLLKNIARLTEVELVYKQAIANYKKQLVEIKGKEAHIPILKLLKAEPVRTILWEILSEYNFTAAQVDEILKLMQADNGSYVESPSHRIIKNRNWLIIAAKKAEEISNFIVVEAQQKKVDFPGGSLQFEYDIPASHVTISADASVAFIDAHELHFPLLLRKWKKGDYFYPLGMQKKKKLSKFFIDNKLSLIQKENTWVLESNKRIVWVIGQRLDNRFKLQPSTGSVVRVKLISK
ncbi:tRNA lysidine(34) synthetase TilS [Aridibaculum aurantiacum]|uniref:tRNA lysidine(34) synthetase TilS n=1 Tax=Aridibaculum aurantiacum TaxID=2810307 RepID=UPI001A96FC27|nr:tRNA lysidine(34) synthetase TilS [Aridibaculum aurantiacum]